MNKFDRITAILIHLQSIRLVTIILVLLFMMQCQHKEDAILEKLKINDSALSTPSEGDWRHEYKEKYQSFENFLDKKPLVKNDSVNKIYLLPIGQFKGLQDSILRATKEYLTIYFDMEVIILDTYDDKRIPKNNKRVYEGKEQILASYIIDTLLPPIRPKDAIAVMAITPIDVYPKKLWNFVFGLASYENRVGVSSINRFCYDGLTQENYSRALSLTINVSAHEITHMLQVSHCITSVCLMQGSNSLEEIYSHPNRVCSSCHKKIHHSCKFDIKNRLEKLVHFFDEHQLNRDYNLAMKDLKSI
jgi:archaemetzincin